MARRDAVEKAEIYHTLYELNAAFAQVILHCRALVETGLFTGKAVKLFPAFVQELQAEINQDILNPLESIELEDWARYGKVRQRWEKYLRGPERETQRKK